MKNQTLLKRASKYAVGPSIGVMIGVTISRTIMFPNLYNETFPSVFLYAITSFAAAYIGAFLISLFIGWLKLKTGKQGSDGK